MCRHALGGTPLEGAVSVFRTRAGTTRTLFLSDGQGDWLCRQRFSQGRFPWRPTTADARVPLSARALLLVLWHGDPKWAQRAHDGRRVVEGGTRRA